MANNEFYPFYSGANQDSNNNNNMNFGLSDLKQTLPGNQNSGLGSSTFDMSQFNFGSTPPQQITSPNFMQGVLGYKDPKTGSQMPGWGGTALNVLKSGLGFYLGKEQLGQAEEALSENKRQFDINYGAQKTLLNDQLAWQYQARKDRNTANAGNLTQI